MRVIYTQTLLGGGAVEHTARSKMGEVVFSTTTAVGWTGNNIALARLKRAGHKLSRSRWAACALKSHPFHHHEHD